MEEAKNTLRLWKLFLLCNKTTQAIDLTQLLRLLLHVLMFSHFLLLFPMRVSNRSDKNAYYLYSCSNKEFSRQISGIFKQKPLGKYDVCRIDFKSEDPFRMKLIHLYDTT